MKKLCLLIFLCRYLPSIRTLQPFFPYQENSNTCTSYMSTCTFQLRATATMTMFYNNLFRVVTTDSNTLYNYNNRSQTFAMTDIITADGYPKLVYVFNNSLPGPVLNAYQGQTIRVYIYNDLPAQSLSVHFHGIRQVGTPISDGASRVTQLGILPGSSYLHEFLAIDEGTFWYHAHGTAQIAMGLLGGFIVHPKEVSQVGEFVLVLNDWQHFYTSEQHLLLVNSGEFYPDSLESLTESDNIDYFEAMDGSRVADAFVTSILINGRGQYIDPRVANNTWSTSPLEILDISNSNLSTYRLRLINGGTAFSLKFSIDEHLLSVISSDGTPFAKPIIVDQLIVGPGERFDLLINRTFMSHTNYWIQVNTIDRNNNSRWHAKAILQYNSTSSAPTTNQRTCTSLQPCRILNCPFTQYGNDPTLLCLTPQNMTTNDSHLDITLMSETAIVNVKQILSLNMVMGDDENAGFESINYIGMQYPSMQVPILSNPQAARNLLPCSNGHLDMNTGEKCYHYILAQFNDIIELILVNFDTHQHPMHLHGYKFHIVEQGFAQLNETTGLFLANNPDIECNDYAECICKSNETCQKNNMRLVKDTVLLPKGGIRFRATNPGVWLFHCHTETHLDRGMALMVHTAEDRISIPKSSSTITRNVLVTLALTILFLYS